MKTLYVKFIVLTIAIMMISFVVAFLISNTYYQQKLKPLNDRKNTHLALEVAQFVGEHPELMITEYLTSLSAMGYQLALIDQKGNREFFGDIFREKVIAESTIESVLDGQVYHGIHEYPKQTFVTGFFANELKNTIGVPLSYQGEKYALFLRPNIKFLFNEMHVLFGWIFALTIVMTIVLVMIYTKHLVQPISTLTKATKSLASGNFNVAIKSSRRDEIGVLTQSFLGMAKKLAQLDDMRKEFISNISHDIQSPLANIKGYTNLLESDTINQEEKARYINIINAEIERLSTLTKQLLLLAALDRNEDLLSKQPINIAQQIKVLLRTHQWNISEKEILLSYDLPDMEVSGDPSLLNAVWDNLVSNAIKYNQPNGSIHVSLKKNGDWIQVMIEDTGIGMETADVERIFDRFYRADIARTRSIEGTGLGLSIVKTILELHGGTISVNSEQSKGTTFIIELPID